MWDILCHRRVRALTEEADARRKAEAAEAEERRNAHVQVSAFSSLVMPAMP